jgi:hypothetical protein
MSFIYIPLKSNERLHLSYLLTFFSFRVLKYVIEHTVIIQSRAFFLFIFSFYCV